MGPGYPAGPASPKVSQFLETVYTSLGSMSSSRRPASLELVTPTTSCTGSHTWPLSTCPTHHKAPTQDSLYTPEPPEIIQTSPSKPVYHDSPIPSHGNLSKAPTPAPTSWLTPGLPTWPCKVGCEPSAYGPGGGINFFLHGSHVRARRVTLYSPACSLSFHKIGTVASSSCGY